MPSNAPHESGLAYLRGQHKWSVESIRNNIDFDSQCKINRFFIKRENLVTRKRRMKIASSISGSKVLVLGNTKIELDFKGTKQRGKNKTVFNQELILKFCERIGLTEKASPTHFDQAVLGIGPQQQRILLDFAMVLVVRLYHCHNPPGYSLKS